MGPTDPHQHDDTDALFAAEVQSFLQGKLGPAGKRTLFMCGHRCERPMGGIARASYRSQGFLDS